MPETVTPERPTPITGAQLREHYRGEATAAGLELDDADHARGVGLDVARERGDVGRRTAGVVGELADLLGHDGEAPALADGPAQPRPPVATDGLLVRR